MFSHEHFEKILPGLKLFNQQKYWECHEVLEDPWFEDQGDPVRNVYWAVIQVAAALHHVQNQNLTGSIGMIKKAQEKISKCEDLRLETPLLEEKLNWNHFKSLVNDLYSQSSLNDFEILCQFRFPDPKMNV